VHRVFHGIVRVMRLHLDASTQAPRHAFTTALLDAIGRAGTVEDARQHSNKQVSIRLSLAPGRADALRGELEALPLRLSDASRTTLQGAPPDAPADGWLVVTFLHDEPDLRVTAPAVPG
jgi:hypothetical protein